MDNSWEHCCVKKLRDRIAFVYLSARLDASARFTHNERCLKSAKCGSSKKATGSIPEEGVPVHAEVSLEAVLRDGHGVRQHEGDDHEFPNVLKLQFQLPHEDIFFQGLYLIQDSRPVCEFVV